METEKKDIVVNLRLPESLFVLLKSYSLTTNQTRSAITRAALIQYISFALAQGNAQAMRELYSELRERLKRQHSAPPKHPPK